MPDAKGTTVPIKLTVSGQSEVVQAMQKVAKESREAWLASIPAPQFIDSFEKTAARATKTATDAAKAIKINYQALSQESQRAASFMQDVATTGSRTYAGLDKGGLKLQSFTSDVSGLAYELQRIPNLESLLGLSALGFGVENVRALFNIVKQVATFTAGAGAIGGAATGGASLAAIPIFTAATRLYQIYKTDRETVDSRESNNIKLLTDMGKLVSERIGTGELRGEVPEEIRSEINALISRQNSAKNSKLRTFIGEDVQNEAARLVKRLRDLSRETYATEESGALSHAQALSEINSTRLDGEARTLQAALEAKLRDTSASETDQLDASRAYVDRMRGIAVEAAASQREILGLKETQLNAELSRSINDPDAAAKVRNSLTAIADQRVLIEQETDAKLEVLESQHVGRVEKIRIDAQKRQEDAAEKLAREQEKAAEAEQRAARQAQRDADRLLQTKQQELVARMAAVNAAYDLSNVEKFQIQSGLIAGGRADGSLTPKEADAFQSRLGPDPNSVRAQMTSATVELQNQFGTVAQGIANTFKNTIGSAVDSISNGISGLILRTKTWAQALSDIGSSILTTVVNSIVRMGVQWIATQILMATVGKAIMGASVASSVPFAAASSAIWAAPATLATIATFGSAAAAAPGFIAASNAITTASAVSQSLVGFMSGGYTGSSPRNQVAGVVHGQEYVVNAATVQRVGLPALEAMQSGSSSAPASSGSNVRIATFDSRLDAKRWAESEDGETWFVDMARRTAHKTGRPA